MVKPLYWDDTEKLIREAAEIQTAANINYYVRTDGNDSNTGLVDDADHAFLTIAKAISMVPQIVNHTIHIHVHDGGYTEEITLNGYTGKGTVQIIGTNVENVIVTGSIAVSNCSCLIYITNLDVVSAYTAVDVTNCSYVSLDTLTMDESGNAGISVCMANVMIGSCIISNKGAAITSYDFGYIHSTDCAGSLNTVVLYAFDGGLILYAGTVPTGTTAQSVSTGGYITDNPQHLNKTLLDSYTQTETDLADTVSKKHTAGSDTTLGIMAADINMNTHKLTALSAPSSTGESVRTTAKITEAALEDAADKKHAAGDDSDLNATFEATFGKHADKLSAFAATTSAELAAVISDETGTDKLVYNTSPTLVTPTIGAALATTINGSYIKNGLTSLAASTTKTVTITTADMYNAFEVGFGVYVSAGQGAGGLTLVVSGILATTNLYNVAEVGRWNIGDVVISAVTKNTTSITFTVQNVDAVQGGQIAWYAIGAGNMSVAIA